MALLRGESIGLLIGGGNKWGACQREGNMWWRIGGMGTGMKKKMEKKKRNVTGLNKKDTYIEGYLYIYTDIWVDKYLRGKEIRILIFPVCEVLGRGDFAPYCAYIFDIFVLSFRLCFFLFFPSPLVSHTLATHCVFALLFNSTIFVVKTYIYLYMHMCL